MNVLFVSNDPRIFQEGSDVRIRMQLYAKELGTLHMVSRAPGDAHVVEDGNLTLHPYRGSRLSMSNHVRELILKHSIEIVSAQDPFEYGWIATKAVEGTNAKLHIQIHTDFLSPWFIKGVGFRAPRVRVPILNFVRRRLADRVLPRAHGIRVVSERVQRSVVEHYGTHVVVPTVIPVPVPALLPAKIELPPHSFSFALFTASRLEPEKRIQDILYAMARIKYQYPSVGLFVVGTGSEAGELKRLAKRLGLTGRVIFIEEWRSDVLGLMQSAQAYIQASAYEGYGRAIIEAGLARLPIITTDVGIVGEVFSGYHDVLSAPIADPAALAVHIRGLVDDHQARALLGFEAEKTAQTHLAGVGDIPKRIADDLSQTLQRA